MDSWHLTFARLAEYQPVGTEAERTQALTRWTKIPAYVRQEISNLRAGLAHKPLSGRGLNARQGPLRVSDSVRRIQLRARRLLPPLHHLQLCIVAAELINQPILGGSGLAFLFMRTELWKEENAHLGVCFPTRIRPAS
ncbi:MAG TPA: hypothetical protein DCE44_17960 [Verrucomicrobiales bacterium]|nr:hypothetical protein [Verrucomicrobiales bacterium]